MKNEMKNICRMTNRKADDHEGRRKRERRLLEVKVSEIDLMRGGKRRLTTAAVKEIDHLFQNRLPSFYCSILLDWIG